MGTSVKWFSSDMFGIPQLTRNQGELVTLLDAVLVNGFNTNSVTSITRSGELVTVSFAAAHNYLEYQIVEISGANEAQFNGQFRVYKASTNSFTIVVPDTGATVATGTISCKTASMGWQKIYSGLYKAVYRSPNVLSNRPFLRVQNTMHTNWAAGHHAYGNIHCATDMSDIDTFTGEVFPYRPDRPLLQNGGWMRWFYAMSGNCLPEQHNTSYPASTTNKFFRFFGDDRSFYFGVRLSASTTSGTSGTNTLWYGVGDFNSYKAADAYDCFMIANERYQNADSALNANTNSTFSAYNGFGMPYDSLISSTNNQGQMVFRNYTGYGIPSNFGTGTLNFTNSTITSNVTTSVSYPNLVNNGLFIQPVYMYETFSSSVRGVLPGRYVIGCNAGANLFEGQIFDNVVNYANRKFMFANATRGDEVNAGGGGVFGDLTLGGWLFDIDGPWEY